MIGGNHVVVAANHQVVTLLGGQLVQSFEQGVDEQLLAGGLVGAEIMSGALQSGPSVSGSSETKRD